LNGVHYRDHREFKPWEHSNIFISFKNRQVLESSINADKILYFTTEIEGKWPQAQLNQVDQVITISKFHTHRMGDAGHPKLKHEYLWADMERMAKNRVAREEGTMLYSSSFDRGLEELLACWDTVKKKMNLKKLYITYGWDFINLIAKDNPNMAKWKERMEKLIEQHKEDIVFLGRVSFDEMCQQYWKCQYWCLPLNNADSELFCINAIKAQAAGCIPLVRRTGALQETVNNFVAWEDVSQWDTFKDLTEKQVLENKQFANNFSLKTRLSEFTKLFN
jgi:glycosyltransferase involved in cell wall biosynthesis